MRKTSTYARKRLQKPVHFNGAEWLNTIGRCRPYSDEPVIGSWLPEGTIQIANHVLVEARMAYQGIKDGLFKPDHTDPYDMLTHVTGVAKIRAIQIAGNDPETNCLLPVIMRTEDGLSRIRARWEKLQVWGMDGPAIADLAETLNIYQEILTQSTPQQMADATDARIAILKRMRESE